MTSQMASSELVKCYDEIDQIYDYIRGLAPLPLQLRKIKAIDFEKLRQRDLEQQQQQQHRPRDEPQQNNSSQQHYQHISAGGQKPSTRAQLRPLPAPLLSDTEQSGAKRILPLKVTIKSGASLTPLVTRVESLNLGSQRDLNCLASEPRTTAARSRKLGRHIDSTRLSRAQSTSNLIDERLYRASGEQSGFQVEPWRHVAQKEQTRQFSTTLPAPVRLSPVTRMIPSRVGSGNKLELNPKSNNGTSNGNSSATNFLNLNAIRETTRAIDSSDSIATTTSSKQHLQKSAAKKQIDLLKQAPPKLQASNLRESSSSSRSNKSTPQSSSSLSSSSSSFSANRRAKQSHLELEGSNSNSSCDEESSKEQKSLSDYENSRATESSRTSSGSSASSSSTSIANVELSPRQSGRVRSISERKREVSETRGDFEHIYEQIPAHNVAIISGSKPKQSLEKLVPHSPIVAAPQQQTSAGYRQKAALIQQQQQQLGHKGLGSARSSAKSPYMYPTAFAKSVTASQQPIRPPSQSRSHQQRQVQAPLLLPLERRNKPLPSMTISPFVFKTQQRLSVGPEAVAMKAPQSRHQLSMSNLNLLSPFSKKQETGGHLGWRTQQSRAIGAKQQQAESNPVTTSRRLGRASGRRLTAIGIEQATLLELNKFNARHDRLSQQLADDAPLIDDDDEEESHDRARAAASLNLRSQKSRRLQQEPSKQEPQPNSISDLPSVISATTTSSTSSDGSSSSSDQADRLNLRRMKESELSAGNFVSSSSFIKCYHRRAPEPEEEDDEDEGKEDQKDTRAAIVGQQQQQQQQAKRRKSDKLLSLIGLRSPAARPNSSSSNKSASISSSGQAVNSAPVAKSRGPKLSGLTDLLSRRAPKTGNMVKLQPEQRSQQPQHQMQAHLFEHPTIRVAKMEPKHQRNLSRPTVGEANRNGSLGSRPTSGQTGTSSLQRRLVSMLALNGGGSAGGQLDTSTTNSTSSYEAAIKNSRQIVRQQQLDLQQPPLPVPKRKVLQLGGAQQGGSKLEGSPGLIQVPKLSRQSHLLSRPLPKPPSFGVESGASRHNLIQANTMSLQRNPQMFTSRRSAPTSDQFARKQFEMRTAISQQQQQQHRQQVQSGPISRRKPQLEAERQASAIRQHDSNFKRATVSMTSSSSQSDQQQQRNLSSLQLKQRPEELEAELQRDRLRTTSSAKGSNSGERSRVVPLTVAIQAQQAQPSPTVVTCTSSGISSRLTAGTTGNSGKRTNSIGSSGFSGEKRRSWSGNRPAAARQVRQPVKLVASPPATDDDRQRDSPEFMDDDVDELSGRNFDATAATTKTASAAAQGNKLRLFDEKFSDKHDSFESQHLASSSDSLLESINFSKAGKTNAKKLTMII